MPTRKQRKRLQKERRHEYETVWVDGEGNELEEPPEDDPSAPPARRADPKKPQQKSSQRRSSTSARTPLPPSWRRAAKRSLIMGAVVLVFMYLINAKAKGGARAFAAVELGVLYALLFTPFTYYLDQFSYRRYLRKSGQQPTKR